jgi:hypothetical protein
MAIQVLDDPLPIPPFEMLSSWVRQTKLRSTIPAAIRFSNYLNRSSIPCSILAAAADGSRGR